METVTNTNITCEVIAKLAVLREHNGFTKELRIVDWNGYGPRIDIREWKPDGKCGKGVTLTDNEARLMWEALATYFTEKDSELIPADDGPDLPFGN